MNNFRKVLAIALWILASVPIITWCSYAVYMLHIGPRIGWLSERFLDIEATSFIWCVLMFVGIGIGGFTQAVVWPDKEPK
jgi:hypothetical protein